MVELFLCKWFVGDYDGLVCMLVVCGELCDDCFVCVIVVGGGVCDV